jgi:hypothetical protein
MTVFVICAAAGAAAAEFDHVRSDEPAIRALLRRGYQRSATFRGLVDAIDAHPGIVYVARMRRLSRHMDGALLHVVAGSPDVAVLRAVIRTNLAGDYAIGVLAHELQHVLEVLHSGPPASAQAMETMFDDLEGGVTDGKFETDAARAMAADVLRELRQERRP